MKNMLRTGFIRQNCIPSQRVMYPQVIRNPNKLNKKKKKCKYLRSHSYLRNMPVRNWDGGNSNEGA